MDSDVIIGNEENYWSLGDSKSCVTFLMPIKYPSDNEELTGRYIILELWGESEVAVYI